MSFNKPVVNQPVPPKDTATGDNTNPTTTTAGDNIPPAQDAPESGDPAVNPNATPADPKTEQPKTESSESTEEKDEDKDDSKNPEVIIISPANPKSSSSDADAGEVQQARRAPREQWVRR